MLAIGLADGTEQRELAAALEGDSDAFQHLTDRYARELHVHCYRMLGSIQDAEDAMQETLVRAWRYLGTFAGRSTFRAWLYRIATNVCLSQAPRRPPERPLPDTIARAVAVATEPSINLSPYPDAWLEELEAASGDPASEYDLYETVRVAFLAAVQLLPARQRAVLILRDVLGWCAAEVAETLESTPAGVNNALHRARATIEQERAAGRLRPNRVAASEEVQQSLVQRYVDAFQSRDIRKLARLLTQDAVLTMPPLPLRYTGRQAVTAFYRAVPYTSPDDFAFLRIRANGQPAVGVYRLDRDDRVYRPVGVWVLEPDGAAIGEITAFIDGALLPRFGLPTEFIDITAVNSLN